MNKSLLHHRGSRVLVITCALVAFGFLINAKLPVQAETTSIDIRRLETQTRRLERELSKLEQKYRLLEKELDNCIRYRDTIALKNTHRQGSRAPGDWVRHNNNALVLSKTHADNHMPSDAYFTIHRSIEVK